MVVDSPTEKFGFDGLHWSGPNRAGCKACHRQVLELFRSPQAQKRWMQQLESEPQNVVALLSLGLTLDPFESVKLADGSSWTKQHLYFKAVQVDPTCAVAHHNLAAAMRPTEVLSLPGNGDDRSTAASTRLDIYLRALELDPTCADTYNNLGVELAPDQTIVIGDNPTRVWDATALFLETLELDSQHACAMANLGATIGPQESVRLSSGKLWTSLELLCEAIRLDPSLAQAYASLAQALPTEGGGSEVTLPMCPPGVRGDVLLLRGHSANPVQIRHAQKHAPVMSLAGEWEPSRDTPTHASVMCLAGKTRWDRHTLFLQALDLDPALPDALRGIAGSLLGLQDQCTLLDGSVVTKKELLVRALSAERWRLKSDGRYTQERWSASVGLEHRGRQQLAGEVPVLGRERQ